MGCIMIDCPRCLGSGKIEEADDPFDCALPAGHGQLTCPSCLGSGKSWTFLDGSPAPGDAD